MKKSILAIFGILLICFVSCKHSKTEEKEGYVEYQGEYYRVVPPIKYDSNSDGVIDEKDGEIGILGTSLNVSQTPDGKPLYSGGSGSGDGGDGSGEGGQGQSGSGSGQSVPVGQKFCYHDLEKYCSKNGGLYAFETSVNTAQASLVQSSTDADANNNNVADYIEDIRSTESIERYSFVNSSKYAAEIAQKLEKMAMKQIGTNFLYNSIKDAIASALLEVLYESNENINVTNVETIVEARVSAAIITAVGEAEIIAYITDQAALATLANTYGAKISKDVTDAVSVDITKAIVAQYEKQISTGTIQNVQGLCPSGYHIPSDFEWMIFEKSLGMSDADLAKGGETEIARGADANVVKKMIDDCGFDFGGYKSINGTYAQYGEAGVYWSSTTGHDANGDYVWVRQIDTSYNGVVRFKMYEKSGLSIRCFKDNN